MTIGPWISWVLLVGPAVVVAPWAAASLLVHLRLRLKGVHVVAKCDHAYRLNGVHVCAYRYVDHADRSHYSSSRRPYPLPRPEPGAAVDVVYDPRRPGRSRTLSELRRPVPWAGVSIGSYAFAQLVCGLVGGAQLYTGMFGH
ncbi:hypothetical protein [Streptomyces lavendofoliae]|uniref:hypothetical protein n=1 Tax=Streptomyces lavendofoliae TaxID=67314 RepID=UPI00300F66BC